MRHWWVIQMVPHWTFNSRYASRFPKHSLGPALKTSTVDVSRLWRSKVLNMSCDHLECSDCYSIVTKLGFFVWFRICEIVGCAHIPSSLLRTHRLMVVPSNSSFWFCIILQFVRTSRLHVHPTLRFKFRSIWTWIRQNVTSYGDPGLHLETTTNVCPMPNLRRVPQRLSSLAMAYGAYCTTVPLGTKVPSGR